MSSTILRSKSWTGVLVALIIAALWISSLEFLSFMKIAQSTALWILPAILGRTFIQTGLFIVAHDSMHGAVLPTNRRVNHWIGRVSVMLYALLPYQKLLLNHWQHHRYPGQASDPDFHGGDCNILAWYLKFMKGYLDAEQRVILFFGMGIIFMTLYWVFHTPALNLILFWILPIILSSMQLFLFGTYLPHRMAKGSAAPIYRTDSAKLNDAEKSHNATSTNYPLIWSFLSCYHFGYHWEHHEYPFLPWYDLPSVHQNKK